VEPRKEPNFSYRLLHAICPFFRVVFPNQVIRADDLARAMVDVAIGKIGTDVVFPRLARSDVREPRAHPVDPNFCLDNDRLSF
jgi:hypothetical protein